MSLYDSNRTRPHTPVMDLPPFAKKFYDGKGKTLAPLEFRETFTRELMAFMTESYINANVLYFKDEETRKVVREDMKVVFTRIDSEVKKVVSLVLAGKAADYFTLWEAFDTAVTNRIGCKYGKSSDSSYRLNGYNPWR